MREGRCVGQVCGAGASHLSSPLQCGEHGTRPTRGMPSPQSYVELGDEEGAV